MPPGGGRRRSPRDEDRISRLVGVVGLLIFLAVLVAIVVMTLRYQG